MPLGQLLRQVARSKKRKVRAALTRAIKNLEYVKANRKWL